MAVRERASASASASSAAKGEGGGNAVKRGNPSAANGNAGDHFSNETGGNDDEPTGGNDDELSLTNLMPAVAVATLVSVGSYYSCESVEMAEDILVCTARTFLQLSLLAAMLSPLFRFVENQTRLSLASSSSGGKYSKDPSAEFWRRASAPLLVLAYVFCFMLPLAAYEASSRTKLTLRPANGPRENVVLPIVMFSLFVAVSTMGAVAIFAIIKPTPWFSPRHVIPLCGMIFNNALSGVSLGLDVLFTELQSKRETIELMISFGADAWTATRPSFQAVLATSMRPQINSMSVIGLVAIPGMMTGQVLSGASPTRAARYQIVIMCLILGGLFIAVSSTAQLVTTQAFDSRGALQNDMIVDNDSLRISQLVSSMVSVSKPRIQGDLGVSEGSMSSLQNSDGTASSGLVVELSTTSKMQPLDDGSPPHLRVNLHGSFANEMRMMTANFEIPTSGDIAILKGASGIGKSTLLKTISELHSGFFPATSGHMSVSLSGRERNDFYPSEWRQSVLYVPQDGSSSLQGTPISFLTFIASLQPPTLEWLTAQTASYMGAWGIESPESQLAQPWSKLSGGESQRVLIAIALATRPKVLLLDEPTSALDLETKLKVEESLKQSAGNGCAMIVVTHDEDQMERLGTMWMSLDVVS